MKSNFFKLCSMFLCGAMFAFAGCSDLEKDIQQVSKDVDAVEVSVTDLQAALDALEAAQEKMAQDYALKADLEKAQKELQSAFDSKTASLQALVDELNETVLGLDANKASKADVDAAVKAIEEKLAAAEADLKATLENINKALEGKANAEDLASAVADIDILKDGYSQMTAVLQNLTMALDGKASQEDVDSIVKDLATLKDFYQQTTEWIANTSTAIEALQNGQEDMAGEIEDLQTASAQLTLAATNLQGSIDGILGRVEVLEEQVEKINDEIDALKEQLKNDIQLLNEAFMEKDTELDQKIAINKQAIEDLTKAVSLLTYQVTNLANAFDFQIAEYDAKIETIVNTLEQLENVITSNNAAANQKIAWLQTQLDELKAENEKLVAALETLQDKTLGDLNTEIMNQISALEQADKDILANIESIEKALEGKIEAAKLEIASVKDLVNDLINDINGRLQSLVFVPSHSDLNATSYPYSFLGEPLNNEVIVKATYQVTPITLAYEVGQSLDVAAALQPVATRAAADKYVWAKNVIITDVSPEGKFDVDIIFDAEEYNPSAALALYVQHPDNVMADDVDPEMGVEPTPDVIVRDYMSSSFVGVKSVDVTDLDKCFVLAKKDAEGKFVEYARKDDQVKWSDKDMNRAPFAGYDVMVKLDDEYLTIAEAAEFLHVDAAMITPEYAQTLYYGKAGNIKNFTYDNDAHFVMEEEACDIHTVTDGEKAFDKTYGVKGEITPATAKDFVGHKLVVNGNFYFGSDIKKAKTVIAPVYTYTVDYRESYLNLIGVDGAHYVAWNYETAKTLSAVEDGARKPNQNAIGAVLGKVYSEYGVYLEDEIEDINYAEIMVEENLDKERSVRTANGEEITNENVGPFLAIDATTSIISDVASIEITGYDFYTEDVTYNFKQVYTDYETFTRIGYTFEMTLGAKPDVIEVSADLDIAYTNNPAGVTEEVAFKALTAEKFADYLPDDVLEYSPLSDRGPVHQTRLSYGKVSGTAAEPTKLYFNSDKLTVSQKDIENIYTDVDADKKAVISRKAITWYDVEFDYVANVTITDPAYYISVLPTYVGTDADGNYFANLNYTYSQYSGDVANYTVENANMAHYFKVNGIDTDNKVRVRFTLNTVKDAKTTPLFGNGKTSMLRGADEVDGSFDITDCILEWNNYEHLTVDVVAQLVVNGNDFGPEVVVTLYAEDPLSIEGKEVAVNRIPNEATVVENVLAGADVYVIDQTKPVMANKFAKNVASNATRRAEAYGAELTAELVNVYYYENGEKVALPTSNYTFDGTVFTLAPESSTLLIPVYAEFKIEMDYTLDGGVAKTTTATYKFESSK